MKPARCAALLLLVSIFGACSAVESWWAPKPPDLTGVWRNKRGVLWNIHRDGTFDVDVNHDGTREAWGNFTQHGNRITIVNTGGVAAVTCDGAGVYRCKLDEQKLTFALVKDDCLARVLNLSKTWRRL